jgi:protein-S-isoprenylcysteine O-methyltransferase Ste14
MSRYAKWSQKEHPEGKRIAATFLAGFVVVILVPYIVIKAGPALDQVLGIPSFRVGMVNYLLGGVLLVVGLSLGMWSVYAQLTRGRGTPLPMLPTQELLTTGPFQYCRNPMTLGTILAYLGIAIIAGSVMGLVLMACFIGLLLLYLKRMEERELAERFGEAYLAYKRKVPFIIPRRPRR